MGAEDDEIADLRDRIADLERETVRRDVRLNALIWNMVRRISAFTRTVVVVALWALNDWSAWWQISLGVLAWLAMWFLSGLRHEHLEEEHKREIAHG